MIPTAHELGYDVYVAWLLGPDEDSVKLAGESALCKNADRKIAVLNAKFGDPEKFPWVRSQVRESWLDSGGLEGVLPVLTERVAIKVRALPGRYSSLVRSPDLFIVERSSVFRWIRKSWEDVVSPLFAESVEPVVESIE